MHYNEPLYSFEPSPVTVLILQRTTTCLIALITLVSCYVAATLPLSPDEAHYALYGLHPDWSYFDHPPLVGWVQSVFLLFSESEQWLRVPPILVNVLTGWLLFRIVKDNHTESAARVAILLFALTPMFRLLAVAWVPEAPLMLIGLGCLYFTLQLHNIYSHQDPHQTPHIVLWRAWIGLGIMLGMAALSKYTAVTLALSVFLVLFSALGWRLLMQVELWVAAVVAAVLLLPILYWNYQHGWISFLYQLNHGAGKSHWSLLAAFQMQIGQLATYGILLYGAAVLSTIWAWKQPQFRAYLLFAWPIFILFSVTAAKGRSLPHWTAMGFLFLLPLISIWLQKIWHESKVKRAFIGLASVPSLLVLSASFGLLMGLNFGFKDYQHPLQDLTGWKEVSHNIRNMAQKDEPEYQQLFVPNWSHGSRYAWYARPLPVKILDTRVDQFDLWFGQANVGDSGYLVLHQERGRYQFDLINRFQSCELVDEYTAQRQSVKVNHYKIYRCSQYSHQG